MRLSLIVAMSDAGVIGIENRLPWRLPEDMKWFRRHTLGKPVIMGRRTYESIGRPLPERRNIVVSASPGFRPDGCTVVPDPDGAVAAAGDVPEVMVMGGASIYRQLLPRADRLYLTLVHGDITGDAHFPPFDRGAWVETERTDHDADHNNPYPYTFLILDRRLAA